MSTIKTIMQRQSVRKFKKEAIPSDAITKILTAAAQAPSAKNMQNWHFVVVNNKEKILELANVIEMKNEELAHQLQNEEMKKGFTKFLRFGTFFKSAPTVIFVYAKNTYLPTGLPVLEEMGAPLSAIDLLKATNPAMQSVGAAIQNLILAAADLGYGSCWMTSPNYAATEISKSLHFQKDDYFLAATIPMGLIDGEAKSPTRKSLEEIATIID